MHFWMLYFAAWMYCMVGYLAICKFAEQLHTAQLLYMYNYTVNIHSYIRYTSTHDQLLCTAIYNYTITYTIYCSYKVIQLLFNYLYLSNYIV